MKNRKKVWQILLLLTAMCLITSCTERDSTSSDAQTEETAGSSIAETVENTDTSADIITEEKTTEEASALLLKMTKAIESQYPEQTFSGIEVQEAALFFVSLGNGYEYTARQASDGWSYIAGIRRTAENPLEGMSCSTGAGVAGYAVSQFDDGRILFMESRSDAKGTDSGLSYIYEVLQQGVQGMEYMISAAERGVTIVPPGNRPFMRVSKMSQGHSITEFIPLSEEEKQTLLNGRPVPGEPEWVKRLGVFDSRGEVNLAWQENGQKVTEQMAALAADKSGFEALKLTDIENVVKAELSLSLFGQTQKEELENREDLSRLTKLLQGASYTDIKYDREYNGLLTLTKKDGETVQIQLAAEMGGFVLGNAVYCELDTEKTEEIWSVFSMIKGFRKYGNQISMEMTENVIGAEAEKLGFDLINRTGGSIHYSLSPMLYKKSEENGKTLWKRIDMIGGFCGTYSLMEKERETLSIPWNGIFKLEGAGTYKIEIQAIPETDVNFPVSAVFVVK